MVSLYRPGALWYRSAVWKQCNLYQYRSRRVHLHVSPWLPWATLPEWGQRMWEQSMYKWQLWSKNTSRLYNEDCTSTLCTLSLSLLLYNRISSMATSVTVPQDGLDQHVMLTLMTAARTLVPTVAALWVIQLLSAVYVSLQGLLSYRIYWTDTIVLVTKDTKDLTVISTQTTAALTLASMEEHAQYVITHHSVGLCIVLYFIRTV